jgi:hypothetical protein
MLSNFSSNASKSVLHDKHCWLIECQMYNHCSQLFELSKIYLFQTFTTFERKNCIFQNCNFLKKFRKENTLKKYNILIDLSLNIYIFLKTNKSKYFTIFLKSVYLPIVGGAFTANNCHKNPMSI